MANFELKITGDLAELFSIASRLGGATAAPAVIAKETPGLRAYAPEAEFVAPKTDTAVQAALHVGGVEAPAADGEPAKRKRRTKAEIAADEAAAKGSAFDTPAEDVAADPEPEAEETEQSPPEQTTATETSPSTSDASPAASAEPVTIGACKQAMQAAMDRGVPTAKLLETLKAASGGKTNLVDVEKTADPDVFAAVAAALNAAEK